MKQKGMLLIFSGPSGSGKDTILDELKKLDGNIQISVSATTRAARENEIDGVHYFFVNEKDFVGKLEHGKILEHNYYSGYYYGTPKEPVDNWLKEGKTVILKIDVNGAANIKKIYPDAVSIFVIPPTMEILENRLRRRKTDSEEDIIKRLNTAKDEIKRCPEYDYVVINDELDVAVNDVATIIKAEHFKYNNMKTIISEVIENV